MKKYLVGKLAGGVVECLEFCFCEPYDIILAESADDARYVYDKKYNCDFFRGSVMCSINQRGEIEDVSRYASMEQCRGILENLKNWRNEI